MRRRDLLYVLTLPMIGCVVEDDYPVRGGAVPGDLGGGGGAGDRPTSFVVTNDDDSGHTHAFEVRCVDLEARQDTFTAGGAHTHEVRLTDEDIDTILDGGTVTIETTGGHPHRWVVRMPAGLC